MPLCLSGPACFALRAQCLHISLLCCVLLGAGRHSPQEAVREVFLKKLPKVLVFHLLRFDYNFAKGTKTKIKDRLSFPEDLVMSHHGVNIDVADSTYR